MLDSIDSASIHTNSVTILYPLHDQTQNRQSNIRFRPSSRRSSGRNLRPGAEASRIRPPRSHTMSNESRQRAGEKYTKVARLCPFSHGRWVLRPCLPQYDTRVHTHRRARQAIQVVAGSRCDSPHYRVADFQASMARMNLDRACTQNL